MKILFMGTPDFAIPCLNMLIENKYDVVGVVTQPDKPKGRKMKLTPPPIKIVAQNNDIPVYQPDKLKNNAFVNDLENINPDLIIVVAYGKILPEYVLNYPKYGCVNVHASLLPKYRGAGPIQWSIINGEEKTGVTTMYMDKGLDTGDIILKKELLIGRNETADELHDRLSVLGASLLKDTVELIEKNNGIPRQPQSDKEATYAPMLDKSIAKIDWSKPGIQIKNLVRGLNSWPVSYTLCNNKIMKIWDVDIINYNTDNKKFGTILEYDKNKGLIVKSGDNDAVVIKTIQFSGKRKMSINDYMKGNTIQKRTVLGE